MENDRSEPSTPTHFPRQLVFESRGTHLFAWELGEGHPFVFLHGGLADHRATLFRVGSLSSTLRLLAPDLRGSGRSVHAGPLDWDLLGDDVAALLDHLGLERAVVGGTSMGSGVALRFALRHPARLERLVLLSPVFPGGDLPLAPAAREAMAAMGEAGARIPTEGVDALRPLFGGLPSPLRELALEMLLGADPPSLASTTRLLASGVQPFESASRLASIEVPVLVVPGTDPQHPAEIASLYARHLPRPLLAEATSPHLLARIARFCEGTGPS